MTCSTSRFGRAKAKKGSADAIPDHNACRHAIGIGPSTQFQLFQLGT